MSLVIRKFGSQNFTHETAGFEPYSSSDMVFVFDGNFLKIRSENGRIIFSRDGFRYNTVTVYDVGGSDETFTSVTDLQQRLIDLGHPAYDQGGGVIPGDYVSRIIAGTNVTVDPVGGTGTVTVNSTGGGGGANLEKDVNQTAHGFSEGDVVRLDGANYVLAQADAVANANAISFVTEVVDADNFKIQSESYISVNLGLSNGDEAFLSTTVAGGVQTTEPANGEVNVYLGQQTPQGFLISISTGFVVGSGGSGGVEIGGEYENNLQALNGGVGAGALYSLPSLGGNSETAVAQENPYQNRLTLIVNSTTEQRDVNIEINIHSTSGTNTTSDLYLNGNVRSDWSDIKFLDSSFNPIPWAMVDKESTKIKVAFKANLIEGDNTIYIDYNRTIASGDVLKLGVTTDIHYDDLETYVNRNQALTYIANYNAHMVAFQPDAYMDCGDKIGAVTATDSGRKVLMEAVDSALQTGADSLGVTKYPVAFGNHDFDDGMRASTTFGIYHGFPGQEDTDKLYGSFNLGGLTHISLDAQYKVGTNEHEDNSHKGYGYINELQLKWLEKTLEEATLPVVIWCHQSLAEFDTERVFLTKETYHVQNRTDVRAILEDSKK